MGGNPGAPESGQLLLKADWQTGQKRPDQDDFRALTQQDAVGDFSYQ